MKLQLHCRFYHFVWNLMRKKKQNVNGYDISYVKLPWWLLIGDSESKNLFLGGMYIAHKPSQTLMVFISNSEHASDKLRYTLYHEYLEGCCGIGKFSSIVDKERIKKQLRESLELLKKDIPDIENHFNEASKNGQKLEHLIALTMELALAKKEMDTYSFSKHLTEALKNRL